jgi:hypothetical protein
MRDLILSGGPWSKDQETAILDYCQQDVIALGPLLEAMINRNPMDRTSVEPSTTQGSIYASCRVHATLRHPD